MKTAAVLLALAFGLLAGCTGPGALTQPAVDSAMTGPIDSAMTAPPCEEPNRPGTLTNLTFRSLDSYTFKGIVATATLTWEGCSQVRLTPPDFVLISPTGVVRCGESQRSTELAIEYGVTPYPLALGPGDSVPVVVAFPPSLENTFELSLYLPARFDHCS